MNLEAMEAALRSTPFPDLVAKELEPLGGHSPAPFKPFTAFDRVVARVTGIRGVTRQKLRGPQKARFLFFARAAIAFVGVKELGMSRGDVGRFLNKDHTTIINAVRRAEELQHTNPEFAALLRVARGAL